MSRTMSEYAVQMATDVKRRAEELRRLAGIIEADMDSVLAAANDPAKARDLDDLALDVEHFARGGEGTLEAIRKAAFDNLRHAYRDARREPAVRS